MELLLARKWFTERSTIGELHLGSEFQCYTLEDRVHEGPKVPGRTAIPTGRYRLSMTYSPRFNMVLPLVCDVPGFTGIRVHAGNTDVDTDGCILVGQVRKEDEILLSRAALTDLLDRLALPAFLTLVNVRA